jgi:LCP family protein required for cell wall assembly
MSVYDSRGTKRRRPRWARIVLWTGGTFLGLILVIVAVVGWWAHSLVDAVGSISSDVKIAQGDLSKNLPTSSDPAVALVVGSDFRASEGADGSRSDTLMLVRIDPRTKYISLLSLPRDLHVEIPGHGVDKINAAYSYGGYKLALKTVENVTGVPVNYLVTVDFRGFRDLVNSFGGVYVPVDQRYYHSNAAGGDQYSEVNLQPGYQKLDGKDSLAFARYRHTDSDFYRNARQQVFLHAFTQRASGKLHGIGFDQLSTFKSVAETIAHNVQVTGPNGPPSVQTMIRFATTAYGIRNRVITSKLAATVGGDATDSYVEATPQAMHQAVFAFMHPDSVAKPTGQLPGKDKSQQQPKFKPQVDPATIGLTTVNGNGQTGSAAKAGTALGKWFYPVNVSPKPAPTFDFAQSTVYYRSADQKAAQDVADILGNAQISPITPKYTGYAASGLVVVVGKSFTGKLAHDPPKQAGGLPNDVVHDTSMHSAFATANGPANFPVLYPTVRQTLSTSETPFDASSPVRMYTIPEAGGGKNSLYSYWSYNGIAGAYWGIEETRFTSAPILESPDQQRKADGRTYKFYFDGSHIHLIAFIEHGAAYWVQNTLRDDMSNADMIAIARSLKPVG